MKKDKTYLVSGYYYSIKNNNDEVDLGGKNQEGMENEEEKNELTGQEIMYVLDNLE